MRQFFPGALSLLERQCINMCHEYINRCRKLFSFSGICFSNRSSATYITYTVEYINIHGFYHVIPNLVVRNELNLDCWFCVVSWFARKLVYRRTQRIHKRLFSYRKKALKRKWSIGIKKIARQLQGILLASMQLSMPPTELRIKLNALHKINYCFHIIYNR